MTLGQLDRILIERMVFSLTYMVGKPEDLDKAIARAEAWLFWRSGFNYMRREIF